MYPTKPLKTGNVVEDGSNILLYLMRNSNTFGLFNLSELEQAHYAAQIAVQRRGLEPNIAEHLQVLKCNLTTVITRLTQTENDLVKVTEPAKPTQEMEGGKKVLLPIQPKPLSPMGQAVEIKF